MAKIPTIPKHGQAFFATYCRHLLPQGDTTVFHTGLTLIGKTQFGSNAIDRSISPWDDFPADKTVSSEVFITLLVVTLLTTTDWGSDWIYTPKKQTHLQCWRSQSLTIISVQSLSLHFITSNALIAAIVNPQGPSPNHRLQPLPLWFALFLT